MPRTAPTTRKPASRRRVVDALLGGTRQPAPALLFGQTERSVCAGKVIALARTVSGAAQRELTRFIHSGLATMPTPGRWKHCRANPAAPVYDELCGIVRKAAGSAEALRAARLLTRTYSVRSTR